MSAPVIPDALKIYNSYEEDPKWQRKFTIVWASVLAATIAVSIPRIIQGLRTGRTYTDWLGIREQWGYQPLPEPPTGAPPPSRTRRRLSAILDSLTSILFWTVPYVELDVGQLILIAGYVVIVICCMLVEVPLKSNANRSGFIAIAQLPVVFLFGSKNSALSLLLLGPGQGYEKLNFLHRWAGRGVVLAALVHGGFWINNHLTHNLPIIGEQKEEAGIAALAVLLILGLTSIRPVRRACYQVFFVLHVLTFPAFFITICVHTPYAGPYIYPPLAFYGFDLLLRAIRLRLKDATLMAPDSQMTLIQVHDSDAGWNAGQHVRLRTFIGGRVFESHPLTIACAPVSHTCLSSTSRSVLLGARVVGDWTRALNTYARNPPREINQGQTSVETKPLDSPTYPSPTDSNSEEPSDAHIQVTIDGPYGGCSLDLGEYENVLLIAGGSGATFTLGLLDDIVGRIARLGRRNGERTRQIEFAWCIRSFASINWFASQLDQIARVAQRCEGLELRMSIYVTCLCDPEAVPEIPNLRVTIARPEALRMLRAFVVGGRLSTTGPADVERVESITTGSTEKEGEYAAGEGMGVTGSSGVAVCVAGPASLTREVANAVARVGASSTGVRMGGIALHTEVYEI